MNSRVTPAALIDDPGMDNDLIAWTFGQPQWHADGDLVAMAQADDGTLWSLEDPGVLRHWDAAGHVLSCHHLSDIESLWAFSLGARYVASAGDELVVWEVATAKEIVVIEHSSWFTAVAFHPTQRRVTTGHEDGTVRSWDLDSGRVLNEMPHGAAEISALGFTSDGALLASAAEDRTIKVWDVAASKLFRTLSGHTDRIPALAWQPRSRILVSAGWDTTARLWNVDSGEPLLLLNTHADQVFTLAFSPDGTTLACADSAASIHIWTDVATGRELHVLPGDQEEVRCLAFTPDGKRLAVGGTDRVIHIWDPLTAELTAGHGVQSGHAIDIAPVPGSALLISNGCSTALQAWDVKTGRPRLPAGLVAKPLAVACSPDGHWIAMTSAAPDSRLHIYDAKKQAHRPPAEGPRAPMTALVFSPDSATLASCCRSDGTSWLWNPVDGEPKLIIPESAEGCTVEALAFHPAGDRLACGGIDWLATSGTDGAITIWNIEDRVRVATFAGGAVSLAFDATGQYLAVASPESALYIWDVDAQRLVQEIAGPGTRIAAVAFTPDGQFVVGGCDDHTLRLWQRGTGKAIAAHELDSPIKALRFSTDGTTLYTGNGNTTCHAIPLARLLAE